MRGTLGLNDAVAIDAGDIALSGLAYLQIIDMYNFYQQLTAKENSNYRIAVIAVDEELTKRRWQCLIISSLEEMVIIC